MTPYDVPEQLQNNQQKAGWDCCWIFYEEGVVLIKAYYNKILPYLFLLPAVLFIALVFVLPFIAGVFISLTDWNGIARSFHFVGVANYISIFKGSSAIDSLLNNFKYFIFIVILQNIFALLIALLLNSNLKGKNFLRATVFLPSVIATVGIGFTWSLIFNPSIGIIPLLFNFLHIPGIQDFTWLGDFHWALYLIAIVSVWQWTGWNMVIYLAGMQTIPQDLYEACNVDGARGMQKFFHITIPMLAPAFTINLVMSTIGALKFFDLPYVMTQGGPGHSSETMAITIYYAAFHVNKVGYGTALSMVLFAFITIVAIVQTTYLRKVEENVSNG